MAIVVLAITAACERDRPDQVPAVDHQLTGHHVLPADIFSDGPTSGHFIGAGNDRTPPFLHGQPVQGFSAILRESEEGFLALSDNGFGRQEDSPDFLLRIYRLSLGPPGAAEGAVVETGLGSGRARVEGFIQLRDPGRKIPWEIVADLDTYPGSLVPVDSTIQAGRLLTGADFDPESFRRMPDGSFWIGEEFGPFLLHFDAEGALLETPVPRDGLASPQDPLGRTISVPRTGGFEGMSASPDLSRLYPMLEKPRAGDDRERGVLRIFEFDPAEGRYTERSWAYRLEPGAEAIGDFSPIGGSLHVVIERDEKEGRRARLKKLFLVDLTKADPDGVLLKREVLDLLAIRDPQDVNGDGDTTFTMPFVTIEGVVLLDERSLAIVNDNNYPFSAGRQPKTPDNTEIVRIEFAEPIAAIPVVDGESKVQ